MLSTTDIPILEELRFLNPAQVKSIATKYGTPVFAYSQQELDVRAKQALAFEAPYGLTVRYAMKANPIAAILKTFDGHGIHIDASSAFEAERAIMAGIDPTHIMITSQQLPGDLAAIVKHGIKFNATSLHQLETFGRLCPGTPVSIRLNVGLGSGYRPGVSVAGPTASFGIWHEHLDQIQQLIKKYDIAVETIHSHIGCGSDPLIWKESAALTLKLIESFPTVTTLNLGGGFKVARMAQEIATDLQALSHDVSNLLRSFAKRTHRKLHLEIEPGTYLVANTGTLISRVQDITDTGTDGFTFIKLDTGMNDIMRPALHASQHPIIVVGGDTAKTKGYVVVGHNCESSDLLTPSPEDSELPQPRLLPETKIDDLVAIEGVGAYCSSMRLIGYNSFPAPNEVMVAEGGDLRLIYRSQGIKEFAATEIA